MVAPAIEAEELAIHTKECNIPSFNLPSAQDESVKLQLIGPFSDIHHQLHTAIHTSNRRPLASSCAFSIRASPTADQSFTSSSASPLILVVTAAISSLADLQATMVAKPCRSFHPPMRDECSSEGVNRTPILRLCSNGERTSCAALTPPAPPQSQGPFGVWRRALLWSVAWAVLLLRTWCCCARAVVRCRLLTRLAYLTLCRRLATYNQEYHCKQKKL